MSCPSCVSCIADTHIIIQIRLFICSSVPYISSNHPTFCTYIFSYLKLLCLYFHIPQLLPTVAIYACAAPPKFCTKCCTGTPLLSFLCIYLYVVNVCICVFWIGVFVCCKFGYFSFVYMCICILYFLALSCFISSFCTECHTGTPQPQKNLCRVGHVHIVW